MADGARYTLTVSQREENPPALPAVTAAFDGSHSLAIAQISTKKDFGGGGGGPTGPSYFEAGTVAHPYDAADFVQTFGNGSSSFSPLVARITGGTQGTESWTCIHKGKPTRAEATDENISSTLYVGQVLFESVTNRLYFVLSGGTLALNANVNSSTNVASPVASGVVGSTDIVYYIDFAPDGSASGEISVDGVAYPFTHPAAYDPTMDYGVVVNSYGSGLIVDNKRVYIEGAQGEFPFQDTAPAGNYWIDTWGGTIDTPDPDASWVIGNRYLQQVQDLASLVDVPWSYYVDAALDLVWIRTEPYFWAYNAPAGANRAEEQLRFSSAVSDPLNPSDDTIGGVRYPTRLKIPQTPLALSTPTHGITVSDITNFTVTTNDGILDDKIDSMVHSRVQLRKSYNGGGFSTIYIGEVMDVKNNFSTIQIKCSQRFGGLTQAATKTVSEAFGDKLSAYELEDDVEGKTCPRVYGYAAGVALVKLGTVKGAEKLTTAYAYHDPTALTGGVEVVGVVFDDGRAAPSDFRMVSPGIIEIPDSSGVAEFADVVTRDVVKNRIYTAPTATRDILRDLAGIPSDSSAWDQDELDETIRLSLQDHIGTVITGGTARAAVEDFIKNGLYHLLETPDGRFTVRVFGNAYTTWVVPEWIHTKNPEVSFYDRRLLTTSARVKWRKATEGAPSTEDGAQRWAVYDAEEAVLLTEGGRAHRLELETDLTNKSSADALAQQLVGYFGKRLKVVAVNLGDNLAEITQLDTIETSILINGRQLAPGTSYVVADLDRAQDKALLISAADFGDVTEIHETGNSIDEIHETGIEPDEIHETGVL